MQPRSEALIEISQKISLWPSFSMWQCYRAKFVSPVGSAMAVNRAVKERKDGELFSNLPRETLLTAPAVFELSCCLHARMMLQQQPLQGGKAALGLDNRKTRSCSYWYLPLIFTVKFREVSRGGCEAQSALHCLACIKIWMQFTSSK